MFTKGQDAPTYDPPRGIQDFLKVVLASYIPASKTKDATLELNRWFRRVPAALRPRVSLLADFTLDSGASNGSNPPPNPYLSIRKPDLAPDMQSGVFLAYVFRSDMTAVYLSLNQGSENSKFAGTANRETTLKKFAESLRARIRVPDKFNTDDLVLLPGSRGFKGRMLQAGNICSIEYDANNLPDEQTLQHDLEALLQSYVELTRADIDRIIGVEQRRPPNSLFSAPRNGELTEYTFEQLQQDTLWAKEALEEVIEALRPVTGGPSRQVILTGPPGTGKTWVAKQIVRHLTVGRRELSRLVQFHPSYAYEQFMEGLRPTVKPEGGIDFSPEPGVVLKMVRECIESASPERRYLIIDEMNRANLPRVLGELMYLFEYRDESIDLPYTAGFKLPWNLGFIGTMNTADRSIRSIDLALRRRFDIFECPPDRAILEAYYDDERYQTTVPDLLDGFDKLNAFLEEQLDKYHTIGHTFFMDSTVFTDDALRKVWRRRILPTIAEYFFDQPDALEDITVERFWPSLG